jgi:hypothetical protein
MWVTGGGPDWGTGMKSIIKEMILLSCMGALYMGVVLTAASLLG